MMSSSRFIPLLILCMLVALSGYVAVLLLKDRSSVQLTFTPVAFSDLDGWQDDPLVPALKAFIESCDAVLRMPANKPMPGAKIGGQAKDWQPVCTESIALHTRLNQSQIVPAQKTALTRKFFERSFTPLAVTLKNNPVGKFTGYYEPLLYGSATRSDRFHTPLLARPSDLVMVDLGQFRRDLKGRRVAGHVVNGKLIPYPDRAAISKGALKARATPIVWVDDAVMAFSLHIQGSGRVLMEDGRMMRVGYSAQNGHPYVAIGRVMVKKGYLKRSEVSMPAIQKWLRENPDKAAEVMNANPSYIFMRLYEGPGPFGSAGVPLTARRSLAVDRLHLPLNAPIYLQTTHPDPTTRAPDAAAISFNTLMISQDTGGAITGAIRGDVFWGYGPEAAEIAGRMAHSGRYYLFLPNDLAILYLQSEQSKSL